MRAQCWQTARSVKIVGDELHPVGKVRDFAPYVAKIKDSGADTVVTGNWGNDCDAAGAGRSGRPGWP